ncbi:MAG TPA: SH3 domain-containing protein [Clostridiaceae bacterium]|nr:SH3 domain-containing protein [Clostridiaceae bacterium]
MIKKKIGVMLASFIAFAALSGVTALAEDQYQTTARLNLRSGPSTSYAVKTTLPQGATVDSIEMTNTGWREVRYGDTVGFVHYQYITPLETLYTTTARLNMRTGPSTSNGIILTLPQGAEVDYVADSAAGWYEIRYAGKTGFVSSAYVNKATTVMPQSLGALPVAFSSTSTRVVTSANLNMRTGPSTSNGVIVTIPGGTSVGYLSTAANGWYQVSYGGQTGYVSNGYAALKNGDVLSLRALEIAATQLGKAYGWGDEGPDTYDCSGLLQWAYNKAGYYNMPRTTNTQYTTGQRVERANVQIGDLIYFKTGDGSAAVDHVGIYAGDNMMLHASGTYGKVVITEVYWNYMVDIRRH